MAMPKGPHSSPRAVSTGSPGDMDAAEEAQAPDTSLEEQETPAPEPMAIGRHEPLSPSSAGESLPLSPGPCPWPGQDRDTCARNFSTGEESKAQGRRTQCGPNEGASPA